MMLDQNNKTTSNKDTLFIISIVFFSSIIFIALVWSFSYRHIASFQSTSNTIAMTPQEENKSNPDITIDAEKEAHNNLDKKLSTIPKNIPLDSIEYYEFVDKIYRNILKENDNYNNLTSVEKRIHSKETLLIIDLKKSIRLKLNEKKNIELERTKNAAISISESTSKNTDATPKKKQLKHSEEKERKDEEKGVSMDLKKAKEILDRDHQGMEETKERILEFLAVQKRVGKNKGAVICLSGPPGVGKTTLAQSIAEATGRKFVRLSMAGIRDEAIIRGFSKTYVSSEPGMIIKALKEARTKNPVILLDEIDKIAADAKGDPAAALLEALDPAQNHAFRDHYVETGTDLSQVLFITTSNNNENISKPLLDRMEIIEVPRYKLNEKMCIAKKNLIPKALAEHGLDEDEMSLSDEALEMLINDYTGEAGVRQLNRALAKICRKVVKKIELSSDIEKVNITTANMQTYMGDEDAPETRDMHSKLEKLESLPLVYKKAAKELKNLESISDNQDSSKASDLKLYLDWFFSVPWLTQDKTELDLEKAKNILDRDHQGLQKVKENILEHLAVQGGVPSAKPKVICLMGPPGVGKTTLAKSIAEATGRKFVRVALGGVSTEVEIRGVNRSFRSPHPGKIVQALKEAGTNNPVILLDEIDKLGQSREHGDPAAALLEVLDPAQNSTFMDHYMELGIDLSNVMFIATSNSMNIPPALLDRFQVIELSSYTLEEKMNIAHKNVIPKAMKENGLDASLVTVNDAALKDIITNYTFEAGVRQMTREIEGLFRKIYKAGYNDTSKTLVITPALVAKHLGKAKVPETKPMKEHAVGVTQGLWASGMGGGVTRFEAVLLPGKGKIIRTGQLGDVSKESILAAFTVAKKMLPLYKIEADFLDNKDLHVHAAGGKKDGPSAGITVTTSILSAITNIPINKDVCMTGEISLNGDVLPIGGLKEKLIAAHAIGLKIAIVPIDNAKDLDEIPPQVKSEMKIHLVKHISEVLNIALVK